MTTTALSMHAPRSWHWLAAASSRRRLADALGAVTRHDATAYQVPVAQGSVRALNHPAGLRLRCLRGSLWITVDGQLADHVVEAGQCFEPTGRQRVLVYGLGEATLRVESVRSDTVPRLPVETDHG